MPIESKVKRVSAYPFPVQLKTATATIAGQIQKVTLEGFLAEIPSTSLQPGDRLDISFELPVHRVSVVQTGVTVKLYSQWGAQKAAPGAAPPTPQPESASSNLTLGSPTAEGRAVVQLVEIHFQPLTDAGRSAISQFMRAIRQA